MYGNTLKCRQFGLERGMDNHTLQFLHLHTKLASPRLPLISCVSWLL